MGQLLHLTATVLCAHGGQAQPTVPNPRVKVGGFPTVVQTSTYAIAGCPLTPDLGGPCVTAQWVRAALRIKSNGVPLLLSDSNAVCAPTGVPLNVVQTQLRVKGL